MNATFFCQTRFSDNGSLSDKAGAVSSNGAVSPGQALANMVDVLQKDCMHDLPTPDVSLVSVVVRARGVRNWRQAVYGGALLMPTLRMGCLDATIRFRFWADDLEEVDAAVATLHARLSADEMSCTGFVCVARQGALLAEHTLSPRIWHKAIDYRILYEFYGHHPDVAAPRRPASC